MSETPMKTVFEIEMDVRWGDMDAFNHVNNASYLRYIEEARVLWFKEISPDWAAKGTDVLFHAVVETAVVVP